MPTARSFPFTRRFAAAAAVIATAAAGLVLLAAPAPQAAAAPFECTSDLFWVQDNTLWVGDALDEPFGRQVGPANPTGSYNAIGFNEQDGLLWGIGLGGQIGKQLVSIDDTGTVTAHGVPAGLPLTGVDAGLPATAGVAYHAGDVDDSGNLWVAAQGAHRLYRIDIATNTVTKVVNPVNAGPASYAQDFIARDGKIIRIHGTNRVRIIDAETGTFTQSGAMASGPQNSVAMWMDADERLFVAANTTGIISEIVGWNTATPTTVQVATTTVRTLNGDGASCASARAPFGIVATDDDYSGTPIRASEGGTVGNIWSNDRVNLAVPPAGSITTRITDDGELPGVAIGENGSVTVPAGADPGTYRVSYEICTTTTPAQCDTAVITVVLEADPLVPAFTFAKTADLTRITEAGQTVMYSFTITNTGTAPLTEPVIDDTAFSGAGELGDIVCPAAVVEPEETLVCTAPYTTVAADLSAATLTNTATASLADPSGGRLSSEDSTVAIPVVVPTTPTQPSPSPSSTPGGTPTGDALANTGGEPATPLAIGGLLLAVLGGALIATRVITRRAQIDG